MYNIYFCIVCQVGAKRVVHRWSLAEPFQQKLSVYIMRFVRSFRAQHTQWTHRSVRSRRAREWVAFQPGRLYTYVHWATDRTQQQGSINRANCDCRRACAVSRSGLSRPRLLESERPSLSATLFLWPGATWSHADCHLTRKCRNHNRLARHLAPNQIGDSFWARVALIFPLSSLLTDFWHGLS